MTACYQIRREPDKNRVLKHHQADTLDEADKFAKQEYGEQAYAIACYAQNHEDD